MPHQFASGIAGGPQRTDHIGFFGDGVRGGYAKHKGHNGNDDVQQRDHHGPVAAHIIPGKGNGLILVLGHKALQLHLGRQLLHQLFPAVLLVGLVCGWVVVFPCVVIGQLVGSQRIKAILCDNADAEFDGIKHTVVVV